MGKHCTSDVLDDQIRCDVYSTAAATGSNEHTMRVVHIPSGEVVEHTWHDRDGLVQMHVYEDLLNLLQAKVYPNG